MFALRWNVCVYFFRTHKRRRRIEMEDVVPPLRSRFARRDAAPCLCFLSFVWLAGWPESHAFYSLVKCTKNANRSNSSGNLRSSKTVTDVIVTQTMVGKE